MKKTTIKRESLRKTSSRSPLLEDQKLQKLERRKYKKIIL